MDKIQKNTKKINDLKATSLKTGLKSAQLHFHSLALLLLLGSFAFYSFGNAMLPITDPVESNYALTAKEMVQSGNWLSPQIYHQYWYDKPIMIYWLIALSYKIFGIFDFAARLPGALFGALSVAMMYQEMRTISKRRLISLWSAVILGTSLEFWIIAHGIITDMVLLFATIGTMSYAYRGLIGKKPWLVGVAYAFAGLAVLTKGPVGIVLPGLLLLIFAACMRSWDYAKRLFPWQGLLLFAIVALPWYYFMYEAHGQDFINGFLGLNNVVRATVSEHPADNVWWYYLALFPLSLLPWTGPVIYAMIKGWRQKSFSKRSKRPFYKYLMVWGWGTILFYSLMATKYPTYTFITIIPFSVLGAIGIIQLLHGPKVMVGNHIFNRWLILTLPAVFLWGIYLGATFFIKWGHWYLLYLWVVLGIIGALYLQIKGKKYSLPGFIAIITMLITTVVIQQGVTPLVLQRSSIKTVPVVKQFDGTVYSLGGYDTSLVYYTGKDITLLYGLNNRYRSSAWSGKYTMPKAEIYQAIDDIKAGKKVMVIVMKEEEQNLANYGLANYLVKALTVDDQNIYVTPNSVDDVHKRFPKGVLVKNE